MLMKRDSKRKKIVTIGGGTGTFAVLTGLREFPVRLCAVVTMSDDGGSTGRLRDELGVLPPGDVRRCLVALSEESQILRELFEYRFTNGSLGGHSFGNLFLTALEKTTGSFEKAVLEASRILRIKGEVLPVTVGSSRLHAQLEDGTLIKGETNIDIPKHDPDLKIKRVFLRPAVSILPRARKVIEEADLIIIGPGDLYTSLIPNLLVRGMRQVLKDTKARIVYIPNLMTKRGETNNFKVGDFVAALEQYLEPRSLDYVLYNNKRPSKYLLHNYTKKHSVFVEPDKENFAKFGCRFQGAALVAKGRLIRHDSVRLAAELIKLLRE